MFKFKYTKECNIEIKAKNQDEVIKALEQVLEHIKKGVSTDMDKNKEYSYNFDVEDIE